MKINLSVSLRLVILLTRLVLEGRVAFWKFIPSAHKIQPVGVWLHEFTRPFPSQLDELHNEGGALGNLQCCRFIYQLLDLK